jgi:hypothetical protein
MQIANNRRPFGTLRVLIIRNYLIQTKCINILLHNVPVIIISSSHSQATSTSTSSEIIHYFTCIYSKLVNVVSNIEFNPDIDVGQKFNVKNATIHWRHVCSCSADASIHSFPHIYLLPHFDGKFRFRVDDHAPLQQSFLSIGRLHDQPK